MPGKTLDAVADHGVVRGDTVHPAYEQAAQDLAALADAGIDIDEVTEQLEVEGVDKFIASWGDLLTTVSDGLAGAAEQNGSGDAR